MSLPDPNDTVMVLANGDKVLASGQVIKNKPQITRIPTNTEAQQIVTKANKRIGDLPSLPAQMNGISVIILYSLWGLVDQDIAIATGISVDQIKQIREDASYIRMKDELVGQVIASDTDRVRAALQKHSASAADKIVDMLDSEDEKLSFAAANSILDRTGHRPADIVEHRHSMEGALRIEVVEKKEGTLLPIINVNLLENN